MASSILRRSWHAFPVALTLLLGCVLTARGQQVSFTVTEDDPYAIRQLYLRLNPFYLEGYRANTASFGGGIEARLLLKDRIVFNLNLARSYSTIQENAAGDRSAVRDLSAEFIISDKTEAGDVRIDLSSSTSGNVTTTRYINVPGTTRKVVALRGGLLDHKTPFRPEELKKIDRSQVLDTAGNPMGDLTEGSLLKSTSVFAGISMSVIRNTKIDARGYRTKGNEKWVSYYADLLFAPRISLADFSAGSGAVQRYFLIADGNNGIEKKRLGWRTGLLADFHTTRTITFSGRAEFGSRPGIRNNGLYLYFGMGMTIALLQHK